LNFFAEKHGKNSRDAHFSNITKFIRAQSLVKRLISSQDIADAIMERQAMANENNSVEKSHVTSYAIVLDVDTAGEIQSNYSSSENIFISNLESFYNYKSIGENFKIVSSVLSLNTQGDIDVKIKDQRIDQEEVNFDVQEICLDTVLSVNYNKISTKMIRIKSALDKINFYRTDDEFFKYFSLNKSSIELDLDENSESETNHEKAREIEKPDYCRDETDETLKKKVSILQIFL